MPAARRPARSETPDGQLNRSTGSESERNVFGPFCIYYTRYQGGPPMPSLHKNQKEQFSPWSRWIFPLSTGQKELRHETQ